MNDCIFCKIARGEIPSCKVYENEKILVFNDIEPQAPVHMLVIPKKHFDNVTESDNETLCAMFDAMRTAVRNTGIDKDGFRCVMNTGENGGQSVNHIHMHVLGGRSLQWPPG